MPERVFKETKIGSIEQMEADIVAAFAARVGDEELMVFEIFDEACLPQIQEAIISTKQLFFDAGCLPIVRLKPTITQSKLVASLAFLALQEALNQFTLMGNREEWKEALFNNASLVIRNSSPELVMEIITNEFNDQIVEFLAKS